MRKIVVLLLIFASVGSVFAQKGKVTSANNYLTNGQIDKAWEAIQLAEQHEKTMAYDKTFLVKGKILQAIGESNDAAITKLVEDPLPKAFEAFKKALELNEKGNILKSIEISLPMLNNDFINLGVGHFTAKEYAKAVEAFEYSLEIAQFEVFGGSIDTIIIYNTALAAYNAEDWDNAIKYFNQSKELRYGGTGVYQLLNRTYFSMGDSLGAENSMKEGIEAYPEEDIILLELIQYYLNTGRDDDAMSYLAIAKAKSPDNKVLYYVEGILYDKQGNIEEAINCYNKAIEIDPEYFDPYYNLGVIQFNEGVKLQEEANQIMDNEKFKVAKEKMDAAFSIAIPSFEKAAEINPESIETLENLKILYYRLQMMDKREDVIKKLEELDNK